ncbi:MAG TPA: hypothetical protein VHE13_08855 [Opitutus sp.]|nr:hypothetical protein [Opitutus sp.]
MAMQTLDILRALVALAAGGVIGLGFGTIQQAAQRRYERLQQEGRLSTGWAIMPGSGKRIASLLVALALVQFLCPVLFTDGIQWWVSAGLLAGYGWLLLGQLRRRVHAAANH